MKESSGIKGRLVGLGVLTAIAMVTGCGGKSDDKKPAEQPPRVVTNKTKLNLSAAGLTSATSVNFADAMLALSGAADEEYGYPGIGMNYGDVALEGLKINLRKIKMQSRSGVPGVSRVSADLVDFGAAGKELEIAEGFNGKVEVTQDVILQDGQYDEANVEMDNAFSVKAYAYLDRNNDGTIDATIWTTPTEVKMATSKLAPGGMADYGYYKYPWLVTTTAQSVTDNSASPAMVTTVFPFPIVVSGEGKNITTKDAKGVESTTQSLRLDLLVDTFRLVKAWDGRFGTGGVWTQASGNSSILPSPVFPFPYSDVDSRVLNGTLKSIDFYPKDKPAFALSNYMPIFSMVNTTGIKAQVYVVSKDAAIDPFNNQTLTVVLDGEGNPLFGQGGLGESNMTLNMGAAARLFEKQSDDSYKFATSYGTKDANGVQDGGLMYKDDITRAGHIFENFRKLTLGQKASMLMKNGPRCKGEYDYCKPEAGVTAYYTRVR